MSRKWPSFNGKEHFEFSQPGPGYSLQALHCCQVLQLLRNQWSSGAGLLAHTAVVLCVVLHAWVAEKQSTDTMVCSCFSCLWLLNITEGRKKGNRALLIPRSPFFLFLFFPMDNCRLLEKQEAAPPFSGGFDICLLRGNISSLIWEN